MRVGVLASGGGSNLQVLLDTVHGQDGIEVVAVASDKPEATALERAAAAGVPTASFPVGDFGGRREDRDAAMAAWLQEREIDLVVSAGYMQLLGPVFLDRFPQAVINVHPSLLPAFPGLAAVRQAFEHGVKVFGVTVHFIDEGVDTGTIIDQAALHLPDAASPEEVLAALRPLEYRLLPAAVRAFAEGTIRTGSDARPPG